MIYDAIIVGLGPGGSVAAQILAEHGMRVLAFDKDYMPRYKPCGGAISARVSQVLAEDFSDVVEATIYGGEFTFRGTERFSARYHKPVVHMVMRPQFDQLLSHGARLKGAALHEGERVRAIQPHDDHVEVTTSDGAYRATWLIGADGASGLVRRHVTSDYYAGPIAGLEAEIAPEQQVVQQYTDEVTLDFGDMPNGYSWIFPKRDHLSVGTSGAFRQVAHPRRRYSRFLNHEGLGRWTNEKVYGHILPIHLGGRVQVHHQRLLLIGDAARLVDPFLGEGIYYAIKSAHIASHALVDADAAPHAGDLYTQRLQETVSDLQTSLKVARMLYCFPQYGYYLFKTCPELAYGYFKVLCGDLNISDFYRALRRIALSNALRSMSWLRDIQYRIPVVTGPRSQMRNAELRQNASEQRAL